MYDLRSFLRDFAAFHRRAKLGEVIRLKGRDGIFTFKKEQSNKAGLLGCCSELGKAPRSKAGPVEDAEAWESNH